MKLLDLFEYNKLSTADQLLSLSSRPDHTNLYVSFTDIDKIGVNPQSSFLTPNGIYTYPYDYIYDRLAETKQIEQSAPFAADSPYIWVITPSWSGGEVVEVKDYTSENLKRDVKLLKSANLGLSIDDKEIDYLLAEFSKDSRTPFDVIWNTTRELSKHGASARTNTWNGILRKINIGVVSDKAGTGLLHNNEPHQAVFLSTNTFRVISKITNFKYIKSP
jgi:hypothetical protein